MEPCILIVFILPLSLKFCQSFSFYSFFFSHFSSSQDYDNISIFLTFSSSIMNGSNSTSSFTIDTCISMLIDRHLFTMIHWFLWWLFMCALVINVIFTKTWPTKAKPLLGSSNLTRLQTYFILKWPTVKGLYEYRLFMLAHGCFYNFFPVPIMKLFPKYECKIHDHISSAVILNKCCCCC